MRWLKILSKKKKLLIIQSLKITIKKKIIQQIDVDIKIGIKP